MSPQSDRENLKKEVKSFGQWVIIGLLVAVLVVLAVVGWQGLDTNKNSDDAATSSGNVEKVLNGFQTLVDTDLCLRDSASGVTGSLQHLNDLLADQQQLLTEGFAATVAGDDARVLIAADMNSKLNPLIDQAQKDYAAAYTNYVDAIENATNDPKKFLADCEADKPANKEGN